MTDPDRSDELVSAYLDGEATADEAARVEGDPVLLARVEVLRGASTAIAAPVAPAPDERRESAIAAALAVTPEVAAVTRLDAARERRRGRTRVLSAAAAAIVAIAVGVPVVASLGGDDDADTTTAAAPSGADEFAERSADDAAGGGATAMLAASDLGAISRGDLAAAVRNHAFAASPDASPAVGSTTSGEDVDSGTGAGGAAPPEANTTLDAAAGPFCSGSLPTDLGDLVQLFVVTATLDGTPVEVFVFGQPDGSLDGGRAIAFEVEECSIEADVTL